MFEKLPYTNFHDLNLDWVIEVVKDFLNKYNYIEQLIETGKTDIVNLTQEELAALTAKKNELEALLQAWYDTHSQDIANQLAQSITSFNNAASAKAQQAIESIPADYTALSSAVSKMQNIVNPFNRDMLTFLSFPLSEKDQYNEYAEQNGTLVTGKAWKLDGTTVDGNNYCYTVYDNVNLPANRYLAISGWSWGANYPLVCFYDSSNNLIDYFFTNANYEYHNQLVYIPYSNVAKIIVNGENRDVIVHPVVKRLNGDMIKGLVGNPVRAHLNRMNADTVAADPNMEYIRNWPANRIYAIPSGAQDNFLDKPTGLNRFATVVKMAPNADLDYHGYCSYLIVSEQNCWTGFDNGDKIIWTPIITNTIFKNKFLFIGDSYAEGYSHDGNNEGWASYLAQELGIGSEKYNAVYEGGAGFANGGFLRLLNSAPSSDYSDIVICGGFNERSSSYENIMAAIQTFCARVRVLYPNAVVHIGCISHIKAGTGESAYENWQAIERFIVSDVIPAYQRCTRAGASYLNFSEYLLSDAGLTPTDGYHPSAAGNRSIAKGIANALHNGTCALPYNANLRAVKP